MNRNATTDGSKPFTTFDNTSKHLGQLRAVDLQRIAAFDGLASSRAESSSQGGIAQQAKQFVDPLIRIRREETVDTVLDDFAIDADR